MAKVVIEEHEVEPLEKDSPMACTVCNKGLRLCQCSDIDERLAAIGGPGGSTVFRMCLNCQSHYARCECRYPVWGFSDSGKVWPEANRIQRAMDSAGRKVVEPTQEIVDLLDELSTEYKPAVLPKDLKRGDVGDCFDSSISQANDKYQYVEGLAFDLTCQEWILHAWLTDGEYAYDPTGYSTSKETQEEVPMPTKYYGLAFNSNLAKKFYLKTGQRCILTNRDKEPELFEKLMRRHYLRRKDKS